MHYSAYDLTQPPNLDQPSVQLILKSQFGMYTTGQRAVVTICDHVYHKLSLDRVCSVHMFECIWPETNPKARWTQIAIDPKLTLYWPLDTICCHAYRQSSLCKPECVLPATDDNARCSEKTSCSRKLKRRRRRQALFRPVSRECQICFKSFLTWPDVDQLLLYRCAYYFSLINTLHFALLFSAIVSCF